jgi:uncharacterized protein YecE (DUF72 family)
VATSRSRISVGIGSWTDQEYNGLLYPKGLPDDRRLATYATWFDHIEVNSSYHRLPRREWVAKWARETPANFRFAFKLPRQFSQSPVRAAEGPLLKLLLATAAPLVRAGKLRAFFLVLPPTFGPEKRRLEELAPLAAKLKPHPLAVELRHSGWVAGAQRARTLAFFRDHGLVWIAVDMPRIKGSTIMPAVDAVTDSRLAYLRLHGRRKEWLKLKSAEERHGYAYPVSELRDIARRVRALSRKADVVHVVANNHAQDFAPKTAIALQRLLRLPPRRVPPAGE